MSDRVWLFDLFTLALALGAFWALSPGDGTEPAWLVMIALGAVALFEFSASILGGLRGQRYDRWSDTKERWVSLKHKALIQRDRDSVLPLMLDFVIVGLLVFSIWNWRWIFIPLFLLTRYTAQRMRFRWPPAVVVVGAARDATVELVSKIEEVVTPDPVLSLLEGDMRRLDRSRWAGRALRRRRLGDALRNVVVATLARGRILVLDLRQPRRHVEDTMKEIEEHGLGFKTICVEGDGTIAAPPSTAAVPAAEVPTLVATLAFYEPPWPRPSRPIRPQELRELGASAFAAHGRRRARRSAALEGAVYAAAALSVAYAVAARAF